MQRTDERSLVAAAQPDLVVLDTPELNAETPAHLLDDDTTPASLLFVRNTGRVPDISEAQAAAWTLRVDGFVERPEEWAVEALRRDFETVTQAAVIECAGNGRAFFKHPTGTVLWERGAVGCPRWTGVRLADVLRACGVKAEAVYTAHHSPDRALDGKGAALSRGVPIAKALAEETLVAFAIDGEPLPLLHGGPLRIVAPGYPGAAWQKWLSRIELRDREHDGPKMTGLWYRMPRVPVQPGETVDEAVMEVLTDMPVKSLITSPRDGFTAPAGQPLTVRGHAWSGHVPLERVEVSFDGGASWRAATLAPATDRFAWRRFETTLNAPPAGDIEIVARAFDAQGRDQPLDSAPWNPRGYCNNMVHRVRGRIG
jgi:sulfite oxidase